MTFVIKSTRVSDEILWANVAYTLKDDTIIDVDIPLFQPNDKEAVLISLGNREVSEQRKHDATLINQSLKADIDTTVNKVYIRSEDGSVTAKK